MSGTDYAVAIVFALIVGGFAFWFACVVLKTLGSI